MLDLGAILSGKTYSSEAHDINASGTIVGASSTAATVGSYHATLFNVAGDGTTVTRTDLGSLGGGACSARRSMPAGRWRATAR